MPGPLIGNLRDADNRSSKVNQAATRPFWVAHSVLNDLKRMPLHHIAAANRYNVAASTFSVNPTENRARAQFAPSDDDSSLVVGRDHADNCLSQSVPIIHGSAESEHDLAVMVHDFMENGSYGSDIPDSSDGEKGAPNCSRLLETLQVLKFNATSIEKELLSVLSIYFPSIKDTDLLCLKSGAECKGACIRQMLVKHLRCLGYDAAICSSKWSSSGKVPGGEYEYIDVFCNGETWPAERIMVDVDFRGQFEIARPTHSYLTALKFLPIIFVGSEEKLRQVLQVMAEAAKMSLKQNSMPLPPWRTLDYMISKWMSPFERIATDIQGSISRGRNGSQSRDPFRTRQCVEQLRHLKLCMLAEIDRNPIPKPVNMERSRATYFAKTRRLSTGFAIS